MQGRTALVVAVAFAVVSAAGVAGQSVVQQGPGPVPPVTADREAWELTRTEWAVTVGTQINAEDEGFLRRFDASGVDPRRLPRTTMLIEHAGEPQPSFDLAVKSADLIVAGVATKVEFRRIGGVPISRLTFRAVAWLKGESAPIVTVAQWGGPVPAPGGGDGGTSAFLLEAEQDRALLPGDSAVLLLRRETAGLYSTIGRVGKYLVSAGGTVTVPYEGHPFASDFDQRPLSALLDAIEAAK